MKQIPRSFELLIEPDGNGYGIDLAVTNNGHQETLITLSQVELERLRPAVLNAVVSSKQPRTALSASRRAPIQLTEDAGVRLALTVLAVKPMTKPRRVEEITHGVEGMTSEEALYWYASCTGRSGSRALRAMRILLAEE